MIHARGARVYFDDVEIGAITKFNPTSKVTAELFHVAARPCQLVTETTGKIIAKMKMRLEPAAAVFRLFGCNARSAHIKAKARKRERRLLPAR